MDYLNSLYTAVSEVVGVAADAVVATANEVVDYFTTPVDTKEAKNIRFIRSTIERWERGEIDELQLAAHVDHFATR